MSESSHVWQVIKHHAPGYWRRIEDRAQKGTPDCIFAISQIGAGLAELKYLHKWPKGITNLGLSRAQVICLNRLANNGASCYLIARIGNEWLFVHGKDVVFETTKHGWLQRCIICTETPDWENLHHILI